MKNLILVAYFILVLVFVYIKIHPEIDMMIISGVVVFLKVIVQLLCSFDISDKKEVIWLKVVFLTIITSLVIGGVYFVQDQAWEQYAISHERDVTITNLQTLFYTMFFTVIGVDVYIIYSYIFERKRNSLI